MAGIVTLSDECACTQVNTKYHIINRYFLSRAHTDSLFSSEILPGMFAVFGEPKSKVRSGRFHLAQLKISKEFYSEEMAKSFWSRFHVKHIPRRYRGKRLPHIHRVIETSHHGYVVICEPSLPIREPLATQQTYEYWLDKINSNCRISNDEVTLNIAIPFLLNKIWASPEILREIPSKDWRILEEMIAEIFSGFGYNVELKKMTRDGGADIIAFGKRDGKNEKILIECKHWRNKIGVKPIRELIGVAVIQGELPTGIILATTSSFTRDAKKISLNSTIPIELDLRDHRDILTWIKDYHAIELSQDNVRQVLAQLGLAERLD